MAKPARYLTASQLFEGPGDERRASLDDGHIFYPPALRQLRVRRDFDQLQAHFLPQRSRQAPKLTLSFGQVHRWRLAVLAAVPRRFPKGLRDAPHHGVCETSVWDNVCHDWQ